MIIDCARCAVRPVACGDCVVGTLLGTPGVPPRVRGRAAVSEDDLPIPYELPPGAAGVQLDAPVRRALELLAEGGLIPRLRLVPVPERSDRPERHEEDDIRDAG